MMIKVPMKNPIVEMDGDEMAHVIWYWIKKELLEPYIELKTVYIDLSIQKRNETDDKVTYEAVKALRIHEVGAKCPTITPNVDRMKEFNLKRLFPSPNATIRNELRATIFRTPFIVQSITPYVRTWIKPIVIARYGVGDIYNSIEIELDKDQNLMIYSDSVLRKELPIKDKGVFIGYYISKKSIEEFATSVFNYALENKMNVWFSAKDTIAKKYDGLYKETFDEIYNNKFKEKFEQLGLSYNYYLIDDAYSRAVRSKGGFVWALKNYDGDVASDFVLSAFGGSIAMSVSEVYSPEGIYYSEASHGTVQRHYYSYLRGETPYTNPVGLILTWAKALERRGIIDNNPALSQFANLLIKSVSAVIDEDGFGTPDIAAASSSHLNVVSTLEFIRLVKRKLETYISK